jgi:biopolymer transport protein ExbD
VGFACLACDGSGARPSERQRQDGARASGERVEGALPVTLDRSGVVQIGAQRLLLDDDVKSAFRTIHERAPRSTIVITADRATLHGRLLRVVDLAKEANARIAIVVEN